MATRKTAKTTAKKSAKTSAKAVAKTTAKASRAKAARKPAAKRSAAAKRPAAKAARAKTPASKFPLASQAVSLTVNDAAQSMAWYCDVLGFTVKQTWERPTGTMAGGELQAGGVTVYIGQDDWAKGRDRVKGEGLRIYWYTSENIDALAAAIKSRGGVLASEPKDEWGTRSFNLVDPTGYKITVSSGR